MPEAEFERSFGRRPNGQNGQGADSEGGLHRGSSNTRVKTEEEDWVLGMELDFGL